MLPQGIANFIDDLMGGGLQLLGLAMLVGASCGH